MFVDSRIKKSGATGLAVCLSLLCCSMAWNRLVVERYQLFTDGQLSAEVHHRVERTVDNLQSKWLPHKELRNQIEGLCPVMKNINIRYTPSRVACITLETARPLIIINKKHVLAEHEKIVPVGCYHQALMQDVPHVEVVQPCIEDSIWFAQEFFNFFSAMHPKVYDDFSITVYDQTYIELVDKNENQWSFIATAKNVIDEKVLERYTYIKKAHTNACGSKYVDMRFDGMMVYGLR